MQNNQLTLDNSEATGQFREELTGSWYNYEPAETTLNLHGLNHWLSRPQETANRPITQSLA